MECDLPALPRRRWDLINPFGTSGSPTLSHGGGTGADGGTLWMSKIRGEFTGHVMGTFPRSPLYTTLKSVLLF